MVIASVVNENSIPHTIHHTWGHQNRAVKTTVAANATSATFNTEVVSVVLNQLNARGSDNR